MHWLIRLRWIAAIGVAIAVAVATKLADIPLPTNQLYLIAVIIFAYNLIFWAVARRIPVDEQGTHLHQAMVFANIQISTDLVALAVLIQLSGGLENPFSFYFVFHVIIASILLSPRAAYLQATLAVLLLSGIGLGEYHRLLPHADIWQAPLLGLSHDPAFVAASLFVFLSTLYLAAYMGTSIVSRLREREARVMDLTEDLRRGSAKLQTAYDRLSESEQVKSRYLRRVSHELRSPLASLQSTLEVVNQGLTGEISGKTREMIQRAERRAAGLLQLINDLLLLSRAKDAKLPEQWEPVNLQESVAKVIHLLQDRADGKRIRLINNIPHDLPPFFADRENIEQLLTNLIANAIKYTPPGGTVTTQARQVESSIEAWVSDTGIGIPNHEIPKVFDEFYRAQNAREFVAEGTGLGLSIVKTIVEAHQGTISVESQPGEGATFRFSLPLSRDRIPSRSK